LLSALSTSLWSIEDTITNIYWGTHRAGTSSAYFDDYVSTEPSSYNYLLQLNAAGSSTSNLDQTSSSNAYDGDLIELGFFDTNPAYNASDTSSITPNTDTSNMFTGIWTPLTSKTTIGQDFSGSDAVGTGLFFFKTRFTKDGNNDPQAAYEGTAITNSAAPYGISDDQLNAFSATDYSNAATNDLADRVIALNNATNALIGIRFYDVNSPSSGTTKYNTIMNAAWTWQQDNNITLHGTNGATTSGLVFEFDNSDANTADISKVGTGDNTVTSNDFTSTITYHDGSSNMDLSNGSHILSGLSGSGNITLGDDGSDVYTLNVNGANNSSTFSGNLYNSSGAAADSTIIKTGSGEQIITGSFYAGDSATAGLVIQDGKLTLAGANGIKTLESIRNGSGGTPVLELNNTTSGASTLVVVGLSQTQSAEYDGSVVLNGSGSETKIKTTYNQASYDSADYNRTQIFSGVVSSTASNKLVKGGVGELELSGNNTFTGGVEIDDGTLIAGHANALGGSNTVTITKGKLEVDSGVTLAPTTITAGDSDKTMIGGRGTLDKAVTIGSGNGQIDVISPGDGISSSLSSSSSKQQLSFGDRDNAIGTFTVSDTLTLENGGVYDWEITDFTGTAGTDWDLLKFDTLNFDSTNDVFTINIMSLDANGSAGAMGGGDIWQSYATSSGFKFMEATGNGSGWSGSQGVISAFNVVDDGWSYYNQHWAHDWNVWYDGSGSFYLQYSVAPEPSTYVMVTGLMLVPGMNAVRKYRNRKKKQGVEEGEEEIVS
jgi:autotransporter-associated beta strand protein